MRMLAINYEVGRETHNRGCYMRILPKATGSPNPLDARTGSERGSHTVLNFYVPHVHRTGNGKQKKSQILLLIGHI